jgi:hypothetical protein
LPLALHRTIPVPLFTTAYRDLSVLEFRRKQKIEM